MTFWFILLAAAMASGLIVAAVLLWVGTHALLYGRGVIRKGPITIARLGRILRSIYDDTVGESLPADLNALLGKLTTHAPRVRNTDVSLA